MRVLFVLAVAAASAWGVTGAVAQDDPMEAQRCIWRCQAEFGSNWKRYEQCTIDMCSGNPAPKQSKAKRRTKKAKAQRAIRNRRGDVLIRRID